MLEFAIELKFSKYWLNGNDNDKEGIWINSRGRQLTYLYDCPVNTSYFLTFPSVAFGKSANPAETQISIAWSEILCSEDHGPPHPAMTRTHFSLNT